MTVTHGAATRNNYADTALANIDADVGPGNLVFRAANDDEVATLAFSDPAGNVAGPVLTFSGISNDPAATGGNIAKATLESNGGTIVLKTDHVAAGVGGDINISSLNIQPGDIVSCSNLTYIAPI